MKFAFWRRSRHEELGEEIESHLRMAARERVERGENPRQAEQSARREFGNAGVVREVTRDQWGWRWLGTLFQDLRYSLRGMRRAPLLTLTVIAALAAGIGLNAAVFAIVDESFKRPSRKTRAVSCRLSRVTQDGFIPRINFVDSRSRTLTQFAPEQSRSGISQGLEAQVA